MSAVLIPIEGSHDGFPAMLKSLEHYSPDTRVYLITDRKPGMEFEDVYEHHHSTNGKEFELQCFSRWFAARDFAIANEIENMWIFDWDVLVLCNLEEHIPNRDTYPLGACCWMSLKTLREWCDFLLNTYCDKRQLATFVKLLEDGHLRFPQGLSDMNIAYWWGEENKLLYPFLPNQAGEMFCENIRNRRIIFSGGFAFEPPYYRFLTLHCQGTDQKAQMESLLEQAIQSTNQTI